MVLVIWLLHGAVTQPPAGSFKVDLPLLRESYGQKKLDSWAHSFSPGSIYLILHTLLVNIHLEVTA